MFIVFHNNEVWDQYEHGAVPNRTEPIPLYALVYDDVNERWWMWYHSWNNVTEDIKTGGRELPPIAKAWMFICEDK